MGTYLIVYILDMSSLYPPPSYEYSLKSGIQYNNFAQSGIRSTWSKDLFKIIHIDIIIDESSLKTFKHNISTTKVTKYTKKILKQNKHIYIM
jgi:hypothetical protein